MVSFPVNCGMGCYTNKPFLPAKQCQNVLNTWLIRMINTKESSHKQLDKYITNMTYWSITTAISITVTLYRSQYLCLFYGYPSQFAISQLTWPKVCSLERMYTSKGLTVTLDPGHHGSTKVDITSHET